MAFLTTQEVANHFRVKQVTVIRWIKSGVLEAINISHGTRPTYRIPDHALGAVVQTTNAKPRPGVEQII